MAPKHLNCDLHIHSQFSDGKHSIDELVDIYGRRGVNAIAITDHLCERRNLIGLYSHHMSLSLSEETFPEYMQAIRRARDRAWREYQMTVIPGFEITKNSFINHRSAHIVVIGVEDYIAPELDVEVILQKARDLGAFTIAAHPFDTGRFEFQSYYLWSRQRQLAHLIDAWEINTGPHICGDVLNSGLPLIANSDFHHMGNISSWRTKVFAKNDESSLFDSLRQQKIDFYFDA